MNFTCRYQQVFTKKDSTTEALTPAHSTKRWTGTDGSDYPSYHKSSTSSCSSEAARSHGWSTCRSRRTLVVRRAVMALLSSSSSVSSQPIVSLLLSLFSILAHVSAQIGPTSWTASPFNPPALPLAVKSPYVNAWVPLGNNSLPIYNAWPTTQGEERGVSLPTCRQFHLHLTDKSFRTDFGLVCGRSC